MPTEDAIGDTQGTKASMKAGSSASPAADSRWDRRLATAAVWASGISAVLYFVSSNAMREYAMFVFETVAKVLRALG